MAKDRIIAIGLLTQSDLDRLGDRFARLYPLDETPWAADLLKAIDEADAARRPPDQPSAGAASRGGSR